MSYSLISDHVNEEEQADKCTHQNNLESKHDNLSYIQGLNTEQLKMWKLHSHLELKQMHKCIHTFQKYKALKA